MTVATDVPDGTVAVVLLEHTADGGLLARYAEGRDRVPAPRRQVIDALLRLAVQLDDQAEALDLASKSQ